MADLSNSVLQSKLKETKSLTRANYKRMVTDIDGLVNNDWCGEMEMRYRMPDAKPISQEDANEMLDILLRIYTISHQRTCDAHGGRYRLPQRLPQTVSQTKAKPERFKGQTNSSKGRE